MPRQVSVITPENVKIDYELAGLASRAGAAFIDTFVQGVAIGAITLTLFSLGLIGGEAGAWWAMAFFIVSTFLVFWGYFVFFETIWNGQTPGKRAARLRTVREGGQPINLPCAAIRNLIRLVDSIGLYLVGGICVMVTRDNKRLGDLAAGTLVVKERAEWVGDIKSGPMPSPRYTPMRPTATYAEASLVKNVELVTSDQFEAAKRFVERKIELRPDVAEQVATKIARPLMAHLGIEDNSSIIYGNLVSEVYFRCVEERGMR